MANLAVFATLAGVWAVYFSDWPIVGLKSAIMFSVALLGFKLYNDKYMGISAYGVRKDTIVITEQYLEVRGVKIPYSELTNLVIYVNEYLGMPKEFFGIHHGGNNKIQFERNGKSVSINYVIKNKADFERVGHLVDMIEKNPLNT